jgi:hypothetical protein
MIVRLRDEPGSRERPSGIGDRGYAVPHAHLALYPVGQLGVPRRPPRSRMRTCSACINPKTVAIYRLASVARLDEFVGPKQ